MSATPKPRIRLLSSAAQLAPATTPLGRARIKYGRDFCSEAWPIGEGARYWTSERVARLSAANEEHRMRRKKEGR